jgi:hypothetical protein
VVNWLPIADFLSSFASVEPDQLFRQVQQKTIAAIYAVDFEQDPDQDIYFPWRYLICFQNSAVFLDIEDAYDGDHLCLNWRETTELEYYLQTLTQAGLWKPRSVEVHDPLGPLLGRSLSRAFYAKDKAHFVINGTRLQGSPDLYTGLRLKCEVHELTVFNNGVGLYAGVNTNLQPAFEETYDWFACH